jgi:hypothetical protein
MAVLGRRLENAPFWVRWPLKWTIFGVVVFLVCYPYPSFFRRHLRNWREADNLPDPNEPLLQPLLRDFDAHMAAKGVTTSAPADWLRQVQIFVNKRIPYKYDWETWGVADYLPTLAEVIRQGEEDCDGRAVLAAALIRAKIGEARLVGGSSHIWVSTPLGDTMGPMGRPSMAASPEGMRIRWLDFINLAEIAVNISLFPVVREAIIVLAAWLLLLPRGFQKRQALLGLLLLVESWIMFRLAGGNAWQPSTWGARWALLHAVAALVVLDLDPRHFRKDTGRSVS